ncbi:hypothetical protein ABZ341_00850 [Streptomyces sp. NPDC006173]|uniref:hypothetical protein n=1 Tax=Streptomyces sp. NPDC006173 TaxID=3155349 RepID=UPI0033E0919F
MPAAVLQVPSLTGDIAHGSHLRIALLPVHPWAGDRQQSRALLLDLTRSLAGSNGPQGGSFERLRLAGLRCPHLVFKNESSLTKDSGLLVSRIESFEGAAKFRSTLTGLLSQLYAAAALFGFGIGVEFLQVSDGGVSLPVAVCRGPEFSDDG